MTTKTRAIPSFELRSFSEGVPFTVTALWLKYQDRCSVNRRVTQPPHIAGPLWLSEPA
jgi:hypothetical protein